MVRTRRSRVDMGTVRKLDERNGISDGIHDEQGETIER